MRDTEKRITKRDAAIFIDSYPIEPIFKHRPHVIYRRISSPRYKSPKPKYGPPRTKYRSTKPSRAPQKKYKKHNPHKYGPPKYKKRPPKPRYGPPKPANHKPVYGPPKKKPHYSYYPPEPAGFGEPPPDYLTDYQSPKSNYGEPPVDSYGAPLKHASNDLYPPLKNYPETTASYDNQDYGFGNEYKYWQGYQNDQQLDNNFAYSKKRPTYVKPEPEEVFDTISSPDEDFNLNSYSDVYKYREKLRDPEFDPYERQRKPVYRESPKKLKKQWKVARVTPEPDDDDDDDQVVVGGKYAEPPARYVPKFQPSAPMYTGDEDFTPKGFGDSEVAASATISPYVNYKNGNIAFSPQNLNDAFSIVDK